MKLCIVGIGGAGGNITQEFLGNEDLDFQLLSNITDAQYISAGGAQGIWLEADKMKPRTFSMVSLGILWRDAIPAFIFRMMQFQTAVTSILQCARSTATM